MPILAMFSNLKFKTRYHNAHMYMSFSLHHVVSVGYMQGNYNDVMWAPWRLKSPAGRLFVLVIAEA